MHGRAEQVQGAASLLQVGARCSAWCRVFYLFTALRRYYIGEKVAPILTIVIGGNHEASNYMWELWVALSLIVGTPPSQLADTTAGGLRPTSISSDTRAASR